MDARTGERIAHGAITILAFGVGLLLGPRFCAPVEEPPEAIEAEDARATSEELERSRDHVPPSSDMGHLDAGQEDPAALVEALTRACPETKIIYQCPPPEPVVKKKGEGTGKKKVLPPPEPELDPLLRKRLLAWVRDRSDTLKVCRDDGQEIYRMAVIMYLDAESARVTRVTVNASRGVVPASVLTCVRQKVQSWRPPVELTQGRTQLVFGLNI